jgi:hypothetical protein
MPGQWRKRWGLQATDHSKELLTDVFDEVSLVCIANGPMLLFEGEDALLGIIVCNGETLVLEQWVFVFFFGKGYFYHLFSFICWLRGVVIRLLSICAATNGNGGSPTTNTTTMLLLLLSTATHKVLSMKSLW